MADIMDVINGINQAAANVTDGAHDERTLVGGEAKTAGLKRERGDLNLEARIMDGFKVRLQGPTVILTYHSETKLKDVHDTNRFEADCEQHLADIVKYLKKEYKKITGNTLTLTKEGDVDIKIEYMSNIRCWVIAMQTYKIGGLSDVKGSLEPSEDRLDQAVRSWLSLGKNNRMV